MYEITKNVIEMGGFNLTDILRKIDSLWVKGSISGDERAELYGMAQTKARAKDSIDIVAKIAELETKITALEIKLEGVEDVVPEESPNYEEFVVGKCVWSPTDYPSYWEEVTNNG